MLTPEHALTDRISMGVYYSAWQFTRSGGQSGGGSRDTTRRKEGVDQSHPRRGVAPRKRRVQQETSGRRRGPQTRGLTRGRKRVRTGEIRGRLGEIREEESIGQKNRPLDESRGLKGVRRRPTLPQRHRCSTMGAGGLNFRVRYGNGCDPSARATGQYF